MHGTSVRLAWMKPRRTMRSLNFEVKQLMGEISRIIRYFVRRCLSNRSTHRPVVIDEAGPTGHEKFGVVPIDEARAGHSARLGAGHILSDLRRTQTISLV